MRIVSAIILILHAIGDCTSNEYGLENMGNADNMDYSIETSDSESNEVCNNVINNDTPDGTKKDKAASSASTTTEDPNAASDSVEQYVEASRPNATTVHVNLKHQLGNCIEKHFPSKSEEDRCTSTLINYPFSVSIQKKGSHYVTGSLLDKRWILTVAAEFFNVRESIKLFRARLGSVDCKRGGTVVPLKRVELHPNYIYGSPNFDVAMLRMAQPVDYTDYIRPIAMATQKVPVENAKFMTTYWPRLIIRGTVLPPSAKERVKQNSMRVSTQRMIPWKKCSIFTNMGNLTLDESTLCLKPVVTHHSNCMPDAGAPVVSDEGLWGITSGWVAVNCDQRPSATLFCHLADLNVRSWMNTNLLSI